MNATRAAIASHRKPPPPASANVVEQAKAKREAKAREASAVIGGHQRQLPPLPQIGHPESYYAKQVHLADKVGDRHGHEANKVGQYITLALDPHLSWEEKLKYFRL